MSHYKVAGLPWDGFDAYLFDIDGTLLNCKDAVHYFAFCDALKTLSGRELTLEGVTAHGNTDVGILRDALKLAEVSDAHWRPKLIATRKSMGAFVQQRRGEFCISVLPGVVKVLDHLRARGSVLGVATGNLEQIGRVKLEEAGLSEFFSVGGWSDDFEDRADVFRAAVALVRAQVRDGSGGTAAVCVVGDTPADVLAARANDLPVIAVATGVYSRAQLEAAGPDLCLPSLDVLLDPG